MRKRVRSVINRRSARNSETSCCTLWHSHRKSQPERFRLPEGQSNDWSEDSERVV